MLKRPYILLALLMMHINNFAQTDQVECDAFSINVIEENECLPGASFKLGINGYSDDFLIMVEPLPLGNTVTNFTWTTSKSLKNYPISFSQDSTEITLLSIGDTLSHKIYLDVTLSNELICSDSIDIKASLSSSYNPITSKPIPASPEEAIDIDFTEAGDQCSIFNFKPQKFNNDPLQDNYIFEWEVTDPEGQKVNPFGTKELQYFPLEQEGYFDLNVKVIKPLECGKTFVYRESLIKDFVNINGNMELESELDYLCLEPETEYPIFINDFSPILERVDTTNAEFSWDIYRKKHNLRGSGIAYSVIPDNDPILSDSSRDTASYKFTEAGDYLVIYNIDIKDGCTYSDRHNFNIGVYPQFVYPVVENVKIQDNYFPTLCSGKSDNFFPFTNSSYLDLGYKSQYNWSSPNSTVIFENPEQLNTDIAFRSEGEFKVKLRVKNDFGCEDSITNVVNVRNARTDDKTIKVNTSVVKDEAIHLNLDVHPAKIDSGFYFQVDRWDPYFGWIEDYTRTDSILISDNDVGVSSDLYEYQVTYLDQCGNIGGISNYSTNILLEGRSTADKHMLTWNNIKEWPGGVEKYEIQRYNQKEKIFEPIDSIISDYSSPNTAMDSVFVDEAIKSEYCYRIQAYLVNSSDTVLSNTLCYTAELKEHFPTAFTPNNDGINDVFEFVGGYLFQMGTSGILKQ